MVEQVYSQPNLNSVVASASLSRSSRENWKASRSVSLLPASLHGGQATTILTLYGRGHVAEMITSVKATHRKRRSATLLAAV